MLTSILAACAPHMLQRIILDLPELQDCVLPHLVQLYITVTVPDTTRTKLQRELPCKAAPFVRDMSAANVRVTALASQPGSPAGAG